MTTAATLFRFLKDRAARPGRPGGLREVYAGAAIGVFGVAALLEGTRLGAGTLTDMGPGFVPLSLGVLLCGLGVVIAFAPRAPEPALPGDSAPHRLDVRGAACILAGAIGFILLGQFAGLIPATFGCVFMAAMGDRSTSIRAAAGLAVGVTVFGCLLFGTILKIPIPLIVWPH